MRFNASFCDPFNPSIIYLGNMDKDDIIEKFETINWVEYLTKMQTAREGEIYFSPSFEIENMDTKHGLSISAVGEPTNYEFYIFYRRPKKVKSFFGLKEKMNDNYTS